MWGLCPFTAFSVAYVLLAVGVHCGDTLCCILRKSPLQTPPRLPQPRLSFRKKEKLNPALVLRQIRDAAVLSAGDPNTLPTWMTRRLACAELASLVETEAAAKARLLAVEARLDEVERALDVAETAKVLAESRMAKAEAESAIKGRAHLESEAQLTKVQNKLIALRQRCSKLEFEAESMQIRNADLQGKLKQAEVERFEARSMVEVMG